MKDVGVVLVAGVVLSAVVSGRVAAQDPKFHHVQGGHIEDVFFLDADRGWTAEEGSRLRVTTDGGQTWFFANTEALTNPDAWVRLKGVFALDRGEGKAKVWAVGEGGVVLVSTDDYGQEFGDANPNSRVLNDVGEGDPCEAVGQLADLQDIFMFDVLHGWVIGIDGVLKYTADGGESWYQPSGFETPFGCSANPVDGYRVHFFADSGFDKGIILSEFGWIFLTEDGGLTWAVYSPSELSPAVCPAVDPNLEFWGLAFDDPDDPDSDMWLSGGVGTNRGFIFKSSGGWPVEEDENSFRWTQLGTYDFNDLAPIVNGGECSLATMYSIVRLGSTSVHAVTAGYAGQLLTWETGTANFDPCESCFAIDGEPNVDTWVQQDTAVADPDPCNPRAAYWGSARVGEDSSISVGDFGRITLYDEGAQDETLELGTEHFVRLFDGKFLSSSTGFVVGQRNTILKTSDGGENWTLVGDFSTCTSDYLNGIDFSDDGQYGVAVGNGGVLAYSNDYGSTWTQYDWPVPPGQPTNDLTAVDFVPNSSFVYIVGTTGLVKWSANGGAGWRDANSPSSEALYGVSFATENLGYVCGTHQKIYRTTTGGTSWAQVTVNAGGSETLWDIEQWASGTKAIAVGDSGRVFEKSSGASFEQIDDDAGFPEGISASLLDVEVLNGGDNIRIGGYDGVVLFRDSTGSSTTWTQIRSQTNSAIYKVSFQDVDEGFAVGVSFFIGRYE